MDDKFGRKRQYGYQGTPSTDRYGRDARPGFFHDRRGSHEPKKAKFDPEKESRERLKNLIVRLGDKSPDPVEKTLDNLVIAFGPELESHREFLVDTILQCVMNLTLKTGLYAVLLGLLRNKQPEFADEIISKAAAQLQSTLAAHRNSYPDFLNVRLLLRFFGELVKHHVVEATWLLAMIRQLLTAASEDDAFPQRADYFVSQVLLCLPWCAKELAAKVPVEFDGIIETVQSYIMQRDVHPNASLHVFLIPTVTGEPELQDWLAELWEIVLKAKSDDWPVSEFIPTTPETLSSRLEQLTPLPLPDNAVPAELPAHETGREYPPWRTPFRVFDLSDSEPDFKVFDRTVLDIYVLDTLWTFQTSHLDACKQFTLIPSDSVPVFAIMETILGELLRLPSPFIREIYYSDVICDCTRTLQTFPPAFGTALEVVLERIPQMEIQCISRVEAWFSHHLSNLDYRWHWKHWGHVLEQPEDSPQRNFIAGIFERTVRLSYYDRIAKSIQEGATAAPEFVPFLYKSTPAFKYEEEEKQAAAPAAGLSKLLATKAKTDDVDRFLNQLDIDSLAKLDLLAHGVLKIGSKSFTHMLAALERYLVLLRRLTEETGEPGELSLVRAGFDTWKAGPQMLMIWVDRLVVYRLVSPHSVVQWVFQEQQGTFTRTFIWDILHNAIRKSLGRTATAQKELKHAQAVVPAGAPSGDETPRVRECHAAVQHALNQQNNLFLSVFQNFASCLSGHVSGSKAQDVDPKQFTWYAYAAGHLRAVGRSYLPHLHGLLNTIHRQHFAAVDPSIRSILEDTIALVPRQFLAP
eukprot:TRINITY_DN11337_c0_g1_i1.p1 TRINITY_DN11337_c0_g1~~TRINITY_DN11337_c0_g1_i1.p1  ORF type:complete len:804 (+),score=301.82 TRINITY_DN11337_c0_g1_i1:137-2548(+)